MGADGSVCAFLDRGLAFLLPVQLDAGSLQGLQHWRDAAVGHETQAVQQDLAPAATAASFLLAKGLTSIVGIN